MIYFINGKVLIMVSVKDREILRGLAARVREIAELPEMEERKQRWYDFIGLKPERPMVLCYPEGSWVELLPESACQCEDTSLRKWEWRLRSQLYWWENIHDDNTIEPWFDINWDVHSSNYGMEVVFQHGGNRGSYRWDPPVKDLGRDLDKLHIREFTVDRAKTMADMEMAESLFGEYLPARLRGNPNCYGFTWRAVDLIGLENLMMYMYDEPENLHKLMALLRDDFLHMMKWHEEEGLLNLHNENDYVGSGGVAYTRQLPGPGWKQGRSVTLKDIWGVAESQETVGISPDMFREFVLPYQVPMMELTGLNHYGCCEGIHDRIDDLLKLPNMRRFSVSPWCDQGIMAEKLGKNYIFSRKPNSSLICAGFNEKAAREDIANTLEITGNCVVEFIMKDTHTVENEPWRIRKWVELAYEEIYRYLG